MIKSFKHKGLKKFFEYGNTVGIQAKHASRLRILLAAIDTTAIVIDIDLPEFKLHNLKGSREHSWSISVSGNWRVRFQFCDGHAFVLNYEDYH